MLSNDRNNKMESGSLNYIKYNIPKWMAKTYI